MLHKTIDVYRVLELDRRLVMFFDKALHALVKGYWEADSGPRND